MRVGGGSITRLWRRRRRKSSEWRWDRREKRVDVGSISGCCYNILERRNECCLKIVAFKKTQPVFPLQYALDSLSLKKIKTAKNTFWDWSFFCPCSLLFLPSRVWGKKRRSGSAWHIKFCALSPPPPPPPFVRNSIQPLQKEILLLFPPP